MIITAHDVNVPAFNEEGERQEILLKTGAVLERTRTVDAINTLCSMTVGSKRLFLVVPSNAIKVQAEDPDFESFFKTWEEENVEDVIEEMDAAEVAETETADQAVSQLLPAGLGQFSFEVHPETIKRLTPAAGRKLPETKDFLDPQHRFVYIRSGHRSLGPGGKGYKIPGTDKISPVPLTRKQVEKHRADMEMFQRMKELGLVEQRMGKSGKRAYWYMIPFMTDLKTGKTYSVPDESGAREQIAKIFEREKVAEGPEYVPYFTMFIRRVPSGEEGFKYQVVSKEGDTSPLEGKEFDTPAEAKTWINRNMAKLMSGVPQ